LQSIIGALVFSRSSLTCAAEIFTVVVLIPGKILALRLSLFAFRGEGRKAFCTKSHNATHLIHSRLFKRRARSE
jgi:hypothetical protein